MKSNIIVSMVLIVTLFIGCKGQTTIGNEVSELNNEIDSVSYSLGFNVASSIKTQGVEDINVDALAQAFSGWHYYKHF